MKTYRRTIGADIQAEKVVLKSDTTAFEVFGIKFRVEPTSHGLRISGVDPAHGWTYDENRPPGTWYFMRHPRNDYLSMSTDTDFENDYLVVREGE